MEDMTDVVNVLRVEMNVPTAIAFDFGDEAERRRRRGAAKVLLSMSPSASAKLRVLYRKS